MKLGELSPLLDPRKPLRLVRNGHPGHPPAGLGVRDARRSAMTLPVGDGLAAIDRTIRAMSGLTWLTGSPRLGQTVVRLNSRGRLSGLRSRAQTTVDFFTGASTGVLAALLVQEHEQLAIQLRADIAQRWPRLLELRRATTDTGTPTSQLTCTIAEIRTIWEQLAWVDELGFAAASGNVIGLSSGAARQLTTASADPAKLEAEFARRSRWGAGVVWLPHRELLMAWSATADGLHLFRIDGPAIADWVHSLNSAEPIRLGWRHTLIPPFATFADNVGWGAAVRDLAAIMIRGALPAPTEQPQVEPSRAGGAAVKPGPVRVAVRDAVPPTRFLISASESRVGVPPTDLATGLIIDPAAATPGRWRQTWSAEQARYIRVWGDAGPVGPASRRGGNDVILITVLA